jgi:hypothetical protein
MNPEGYFYRKRVFEQKAYIKSILENEKIYGRREEDLLIGGLATLKDLMNKYMKADPGQESDELNDNVTHYCTQVNDYLLLIKQ